MTNNTCDGKNPAASGNGTAKRPYEAPKLISYGTMDELTGIRKVPGSRDAFGSRFIR